MGGDKQASPRELTGPGRWAVACAIAVCAAALLAGVQGQPDEPNPPAAAEPSKSADARSEADRLLSRASGFSDAAARWLKSRWKDARDGAQSAAPGELIKRLRLAAEQAAKDAPPPMRGVYLAARDRAGEDAGGRPALGWTPIGVNETALPDRIVLLVHGLDEPGSIWDDLAPRLLDDGFAVARFDYPNDQAVAASADEMAAAMRKLRDRGVRSADLVCHSMGGLVALDVLTKEGVYGGKGRGHPDLPDVPRLITVGTPFGGSPWAPLEGIAEAREQLARWIESDAKDPRALLGFLDDGDGEAGSDLEPGSKFLKDLNARSLPAGVAITNIRALITPAEARDLAGVLDWPIARRLLGEERIERLRTGEKDLVRRLGDGVVPYDSAALDGVDDVVTVGANHRSMLKRLSLFADDRGDGDAAAPAIPIVIDRLEQAQGSEPASKE